jgi:MOSC domain-containing protein YiiM
MRVVSVNVGQPHRVEWRGTLVKTSIFKSLIKGPVAVKTLNVAGDAQSDLSVHGGPEKAVYVYPHEHYEQWQRFMPDYRLTIGNFGENLTTEGLMEDDVCIGDRLRIGSAVLVVKQPRTPCYKLQVRFGREDMTELFYKARRFGFYLSVEHEGVIEAGQEIEVVHDAEEAVTVADVVRLFTGDVQDSDLMERAIASRALPVTWRASLRMRAG